MANTNIRGIIGYNKQGSSNNKLLAAYENDIIDVAAGTGFGLAHNTANNSEFEVFLDRVFHQNYTNVPITYNGTTWSREYVGRCLISKYLKRWKSRLYLGNCKFIGPQIPQDLNSVALSFPSRVFYSDLFQGNTLTWGIEWGTNGKTFSGTRIFQLAAGANPQDFVASNIKVGDPLFITKGNAQLAGDRPYLVTRVDSAYKLIVDRDFPVTATSLHYWVGSNWFDVETDDGDALTGFGVTSTRLLVSKLLSLHYYTGSSRQPIQGAVGTSSQRSVINDKYGNTYYFHGSDPKISGIYKYNGVGSVKASRAIDPYIQGMSASNYDNVVAWAEGNELRFYLGDLSATNKTEAVTKAVATLNVDTGAWDVGPIGDAITCATQWIVSSEQKSYCGTDSSQILKMDSGNAFKTSAIPSTVETKVYYPAGSEIICDFPYLQVIGRNCRGLRLKYKLWNNPTGVDDQWWPLGELTDDKTEFPLPLNHQTASGIQYKVDEMGTTENDWYIEKISQFYRPNRTRLL